MSRSELGTLRTMAVRDVEQGRCLVGVRFALDVDDDHAFEIDDGVTLPLTDATGLRTLFMVGWDRNGGEGVDVSLERAPKPGRRILAICSSDAAAWPSACIRPGRFQSR